MHIQTNFTVKLTRVVIRWHIQNAQSIHFGRYPLKMLHQRKKICLHLHCGGIPAKVPKRWNSMEKTLCERWKYGLGMFDLLKRTIEVASDCNVWYPRAKTLWLSHSGMDEIIECLFCWSEEIPLLSTRQAKFILSTDIRPTSLL